MSSRASIFVALWMSLPAGALAQTPAPGDSTAAADAIAPVAASAPASAGPLVYDPEHPWFLEGMLGVIQPGPDGSDFGSGLNFGFHLGAQIAGSADVALTLEQARSRVTEFSVESDITSGGLRGRAWTRVQRFRTYVEGSVRLYRFHLRQNHGLTYGEDTATRFGGGVGGGVQYLRSKWYASLGVVVHGAIGSSDLDGGNLFTFTTYNLSVGAPLGW